MASSRLTPERSPRSTNPGVVEDGGSDVATTRALSRRSPKTWATIVAEQRAGDFRGHHLSNGGGVGCAAWASLTRWSNWDSSARSAAYDQRASMGCAPMLTGGPMGWKAGPFSTVDRVPRPCAGLPRSKHPMARI